MDREAEDGISVLYVSERVGLTPFVEGLLNGLSAWFEESMEILDIRPEAVDVGEKSIFIVKML